MIVACIVRTKPGSQLMPVHSAVMCTPSCLRRRTLAQTSTLPDLRLLLLPRRLRTLIVVVIVVVVVGAEAAAAAAATRRARSA